MLAWRRRPARQAPGPPGPGPHRAPSAGDQRTTRGRPRCCWPRRNAGRRQSRPPPPPPTYALRESSRRRGLAALTCRPPCELSPLPLRRARTATRSTGGRRVRCPATRPFPSTVHTGISGSSRFRLSGQLRGEIGTHPGLVAVQSRGPAIAVPQAVDLLQRHAPVVAATAGRHPQGVAHARQVLPAAAGEEAGRARTHPHVPGTPPCAQVGVVRRSSVHSGRRHPRRQRHLALIRRRHHTMTGPRDAQTLQNRGNATAGDYLVCGTAPRPSATSRQLVGHKRIIQSRCRSLRGVARREGKNHPDGGSRSPTTPGTCAVLRLPLRRVQHRARRRPMW